MASASSVVSLLSERLLKGTKFRHNEQSEEANLVEHLYTTIQNFLSCSSYTFENNDTLDHEDTFDNLSEDASEDDGTDEEFDDTCLDDQDDKSILNHFSIDYMKKVLNYCDELDENGKRKHSWRSVNHRFRKIPDSTYLTRFRRYVDQNGNKQQKLNSTDQFVFSHFENGREQNISIHDVNLQRWARQRAEQLSFNNFSASAHWIYSFKKRHNIVSRKITKLVTKHTLENETDIAESASQFVKHVRVHIKNHMLDPCQIINTEQIGLNKEIHSTRTLSFGGEKTTFGLVKSKNACTHSYTLQPSMNMAGEIVGPIFLCLKEPGGKISDAVKKKMFKARNVIVSCSESGKLSSSHISYWLENALLPYAPSKFLLLSDAWATTSQDLLYKNYPSCIRLKIPQHTTDKIQPLNIYYNTQMKSLLRRAYDRVILDQLQKSMSERNNIIKLVSLCHSQMSADIFRGLIIYAWYACGYTTVDPGHFLSVNDV